MEHSAELAVSGVTADDLGRRCKVPPGKIPHETLFDHEHVFPDGFRMVIKVTAPNSPEFEACRSCGVLFDPEGREIGRTAAGDEFLGPYRVSGLDGTGYVLDVVSRDDCYYTDKEELKKLIHTGDRQPGRLYLHLFHGREHADAELDGWGFAGPTFGPLKEVHGVYTAELQLLPLGADEGYALPIVDDLLFWDGCHYGDWALVVEDGFAADDLPEGSRLVPLTDAEIRQLAAALPRRRHELLALLNRTVVF